jgi:hypothetical protein
VDDDAPEIEFLENRVDSVAQEGGCDLRILDVPAEVCLERIDAQQVRAQFGHVRPNDLSKEVGPGVGFLHHVMEVDGGEFDLFVSEADFFSHTLDHFGKVSIIVFSLDEQDFQRAGGSYTKSRKADRPKKVLLD